MLEAGEDPMYIARRVTRFAAEDIGLADPRALEIAVAAFQACHLIGMPECTVHLTEAVVYMSLGARIILFLYVAKPKPYFLFLKFFFQSFISRRRALNFASAPSSVGK